VGVGSREGLREGLGVGTAVGMGAFCETCTTLGGDTTGCVSTFAPVSPLESSRRFPGGFHVLATEFKTREKSPEEIAEDILFLNNS